jgi:hypothetical protein
MSVSKRWQSEIRAVFDAIGEQFDLWTHPATSCHVHVSPGPGSKAKYTSEQLTKVAKGALYWEKALKNLLPHDRRKNDYAKPNHTAFATLQYNRVDRDGWGPVFKKIDNEMARFKNHNKGQKYCFCIKFAGGHLHHPNAKYRKERYLSTNLLPFTRIGTVELRRQGGVASAESAIHRALLAVTLHVSARRYKFSKQRGRKTHPSTKELISELQGVVAKLPRTCHGSRFVKWLRDCENLYGDGPITEVEANRREQRLHDPSGGSIFSVSRPGSAMSARAPTMRVPTSAPQYRPAAGNVSYNGPPRQQGAASYTVRIERDQYGREYEVREPRTLG